MKQECDISCIDLDFITVLKEVEARSIKQESLDKLDKLHQNRNIIYDLAQ